MLIVKDDCKMGLQQLKIGVLYHFIFQKDSKEKS
jgi:hypothetical protein